MTSRSILALSLLLVALSPLAVAQETPEGPYAVWTEPRTIDGFLQVPAGTTLVIRDTLITLGGGFDVHAGGVLVLESTGKPTGFVAKNASGWTGHVYGGAVFANGTPESPILFDGVAGVGQGSGDTVLFTTGIDVMAHFETNHARIVNYTSGLKSGANATVVLRNTSFESAKGLGLVASQGVITVEGGSFQGVGAGFWSVADGKATLRDTTFRNANIPLMLNGNYTILERVEVHDSEGCIRNTVGRLRATDIGCFDWNMTGITISKPVKGFRLPNATLDGVRATTDVPNASSAIHVVEAPGVVLDNLDIGPVPQQAVLADGIAPTFGNVTLRGTGHYSVVILDAERNLPTDRIGNGTGGTEGWLFVGHRFTARILGVDGSPQAGAVIELRLPNGSLATRRVTNGAGVTAQAVLPVRTVDANGTLEESVYNVGAYHVNTSGAWTREGYVPDGDPLLIQLLKVENNSQPTKSTPAPSFLGVMGVVAALGFILRYRRNRI